MAQRSRTKSSPRAGAAVAQVANWPRMSRVRTAMLLGAMLAQPWAIAMPGCAKRDDGADPAGREELPPLVLKDDTPDLLLTWIDERGGTHTATTVPDVPAAGRNPVRVMVATREAGQGQVFY